jgi:hypothetical protein
MSSNWLKPKTCPQCRERMVLEIVYGYADLELFEAAERGELVIGGCCIDPPFIGRHVECRGCGWLGVMYKRRLISMSDALALEADLHRQTAGVGDIQR